MLVKISYLIMDLKSRGLVTAVILGHFLDDLWRILQWLILKHQVLNTSMLIYAFFAIVIRWI